MECADETAGTTPAPAPPGIPRVRSEQLLAGHRELLIEHGSELYRLQATRNGKLILTK